MSELERLRQIAADIQERMSTATDDDRIGWRAAMREIESRIARVQYYESTRNATRYF